MHKGSTTSRGSNAMMKRQLKKHRTLPEIRGLAPVLPSDTKSAPLHESDVEKDVSTGIINLAMILCCNTQMNLIIVPFVICCVYCTSQTRLKTPNIAKLKMSRDIATLQVGSPQRRQCIIVTVSFYLPCSTIYVCTHTYLYIHINVKWRAIKMELR